jgi:hypothetical protein
MTTTDLSSSPALAETTLAQQAAEADGDLVVEEEFFSPHFMGTFFSATGKSHLPTRGFSITKCSHVSVIANAL